MNIHQAKTLLRGFARVGIIMFSPHCYERMDERNVSSEDILNTLAWGEIADLKWDGEYQNWKATVEGKDIEGEDLVVVVGIYEEEHLLRCITIF
jgi:hypothetical protein